MSCSSVLLRNEVQAMLDNYLHCRHMSFQRSIHHALLFVLLLQLHMCALHRQDILLPKVKSISTLLPMEQNEIMIMSTLQVEVGTHSYAGQQLSLPTTTCVSLSEHSTISGHSIAELT